LSVSVPPRAAGSLLATRSKRGPDPDSRRPVQGQFAGGKRPPPPPSFSSMPPDSLPPVGDQPVGNPPGCNRVAAFVFVADGSDSVRVTLGETGLLRQVGKWCGGQAVSCRCEGVWGSDGVLVLGFVASGPNSTG
jgi:hypothetical protein